VKALILLFLVTILNFPLHAQVLPNDAIVEGRSIGDWSAEWWKWVMPIPISRNPMLDTTGSFAAENQPEGEVFFVAVVLGLSPDPVTRHFEVPEGKHLFFPVLMYEADNVDTSPPLSVEGLREQSAGIVNDIGELHVSIDGVAVPDPFAHRAISPVFSVHYTDPDNLHAFAFNHPVSGEIDPIVSDGYWFMVEPLPPGPHVLKFGGAFRSPLFYPVNITAHITVVPVPLSERVGKLIQLLEGSGLAPHRRRPLLASLEAARASFARGNSEAGTNQLRAFQNKVRALPGLGDESSASRLIHLAQAIIEKAAVLLNQTGEGKTP
jgi:hypothetical protein